MMTQMAEEKKKVVGRPFQPGNKFGKGRPATKKEHAAIQRNDRQAITECIAKMIRQPLAELSALLKDPKTSSMELMICKVITEAIKSGDYSRLNFLMDRWVGKVPQPVDLDGDVDVNVNVNSHEYIIAVIRDIEAKKVVGNAGAMVIPPVPALPEPEESEEE